MNNLNLSELLIDIDYQEKYSYEERVDIFNKYGYSTTMLFFTPIYHLAGVILNEMGLIQDPKYGYGHGKSLLDTTMLEKAKLNQEKALLDAPYYFKEINDSKQFISFRTMRRFSVKTTDGNFVSVDSFIRIWNDNTKEIPESMTIKIDSLNLKVPRKDIYKLVEEWLRFFKYID